MKNGINVFIGVIAVMFFFVVGWSLAESLKQRDSQAITYDHQIIPYKDPVTISKASNCKILVAGQDLTINCIGVKNEN